MPTEPAELCDQDNLLPCDLVMKGGITSGIVYPPAILVLKEKYYFNSIGGTSAGAIAAAAAAAAEYNREGGGFDLLKAVSDSLGRSNGLLNLFRASAATQPLLDALLALLPAGHSSTATAGQADNSAGTNEKNSKPGILQYSLQVINKLAPVWRKYSRRSGGYIGMAVGAAGGVAVATTLSSIVFTVDSLAGESNPWVLWRPLLILGLAFGVLGAWLGQRAGAIVAALLDLIRVATQVLPRDNFYGICIGHDEDENKGALTDWLNANIDKIAGLQDDQGPLTFSQLARKQAKDSLASQNNGKEPEKQTPITLRMITSNLSHGEPYVLPSGLAGFLFNEDEMSQFFPKRIVAHLMAKSIKSMKMGDVIIRKLPDKFHFLPQADDLPVVFAARLSMSFPILISAVPLYTIRSSALQALADGTQIHLQEGDLQKNWFSDGGICSNFPIHFYDRWLPRHPTFGINLGSAPAETFQNTPDLAVAGNKPLNMASFSALDQDINRSQVDVPTDVYLPRADALLDPVWSDLESPFDFLQAIFSTAQNYRDAMQEELPSYRERVVQILLKQDEGGLNLNMPPGAIEAITAKGELAGELLRDDFNFAQHWWVRFRVLMAQLEQNFAEMQIVLDDPAFEQCVQQHLPLLPGFPYPRSDLWIKDARSRVKELQLVLALWQKASQRPNGSHLFEEDAPTPKTVLRVTPEV